MLTITGSIVFLAFILSPAVPLCVAIVSIMGSVIATQRRTAYWISGVIAAMIEISTVSYYDKTFLGSDYSPHRFFAIYLNLFLAVALTATCAKP